MDINNVFLNSHSYRYSLYKNKNTEQHVIFLLGALQDIESVDSFSRSFSEHLNCLTLEAPGTGRTPLLEATVSIQQQTQMVLEFIEHMQIEKAHIIAFSYATSIAVELCDIWPHVISLSIFGGVPGIPSSGREATKKVLASAMINSHKFAQTFTRVLTSDHPDIPRNKVIIKASERSISKFDSYRISVFFENTIRLLSYSPQNLDHIKIPCTICVGEYDPYVTKEQAYIFSTKITNSHFVVIKNADHLGHLQHPDKVSAAMIALPAASVLADAQLKNLNN
ncbi:alpha/beta fold hydrolase [Vibrio aerogenes]|uniref:alpha/beta fold hydrolase n=1 Tax=Vibrio aerogenes TaxID=92172 RepID=UPI0021C2F65F|nr:alpha/beta hydrolase [Vibrio aerogenes]